MSTVQGWTRPDRFHPRWLLAALLGGMFLGNVDIAVANIAAPSIQRDLHATGGELEFVVSGYVLAYAMLLITGARLGDVRGYRRVFLVGLAGFTAASLACGLAPNAAGLVLARAVQGIAAALMASQVLTGIQLHFEGPDRARALGLYAAVLSGSAVVGQVLGGMLISANLLGATWRPVFLVNVPVGLALATVAWRSLPRDGAPRSEGIDLGGTAALTAALLLLVVPLVLGRDAGWPAWTWACLASSLPAFALFGALERRRTERGGYPLVNLHLLARPAISWGLSAAAVGSSTYFALLFVVALYLQRGLGMSPLASGMALVSWVAAFGVAGPALGRASARVRDLAGPVGALLVAAAFALLAVSLLGGGTGYALLVVLLGLGGLGYGALFSGSLALLTGAVTSRFAPDISGLFNTTSRVGGVMGVAVFGTLYLGLVPRGGEQASVHGFALVALAFAANSLIAVAAASLAVRSRQRPWER